MRGKPISSVLMSEQLILSHRRHVLFRFNRSFSRSLCFRWQAHNSIRAMYGFYLEHFSLSFRTRTPVFRISLDFSR